MLAAREKRRGLETGSRRTCTGTKLETADRAKGSVRGTAPVRDPAIPSALEVETPRTHAALAALGCGHGTCAQIALRLAFANPDLACVVVGLAEPVHLDEAIGGEAKGPLPADVIAKPEPLSASGFAKKPN